MKSILVFLVAAVLAYSGYASSRVPAPLVSTTTESLAGTQRLYEKLVGTVWLHHYRGHDFEFAFGASGLIERHENWRGTRWRVISPTEVIFEGTTGAKMLFTFNGDVTRFTNIDWDGTWTTGKAAAATVAASPLPPQLTTMVTPDNQFHLLVSGYPGQRIVVEGSTNLLTWTPITTSTLTTASEEISDAQTADFPQRFYRAVLMP